MMLIRNALVTVKMYPTIYKQQDIKLIVQNIYNVFTTIDQ